MLNQQHPALHVVDSYIEPLLTRVLQANRLGVWYEGIEIEAITSSCGKMEGDRFKLSIPYAGQNLIWTILFDSQCPEMGPDFVFSDETFLVDPDVEELENAVPSLVQWNPHNQDSLLNVLNELLIYYKHHQTQLLMKQAERLQFEYCTLIEESKVCTNDMEVILLPVGGHPTEARFMIRIPMDFPQLSTKSKQSQNDAVLLLVTFHGPDWNRVVSQLQLSKSLEDALGGSGALHIPPFSREHCLMDYVPEITRYITERINTLITCFEKRKNFISAVLSMARSTMMEWDTVDFHYATLLLEQHDFHFIVHFILPQNFPKDKLKVRLQSVYHMVSPCEMYSRQIDDIPYSPNWDPIIMATKVLTHIMENSVGKFQMNSAKNIRTC